jgi:hypothetical protein
MSSIFRTGDAMALRRDRPLLYSQGYAAALMMARSDLHAMSASHQRDYMALLQEVSTLRAEISELRKLAGVRPAGAPVH